MRISPVASLRGFATVYTEILRLVESVTEDLAREIGADRAGLGDSDPGPTPRTAAPTSAGSNCTPCR